jgi:uncharacterized protein YeaO (DUF488 family)/uncharacterized protein YggU (UPF0235/DUF167 family)
VSKDAAQIHFWAKSVAPSHDLRRWYRHQPSKWDEFRRRYFAELDGNPEGLTELHSHLGAGTVTLVFSSKEEQLNNASALREYLESSGKRRRRLTTSCRLRVKVVPSSSRDGVGGWLDDALKVRVTAPAERGRANAAVERVVAQALEVPARCARVVAGGSSARKIVEIDGLAESEVYRRLGGPPQSGRS